MKLTDTLGLEVVLGVGDRCTMTSAIQGPRTQDVREGSGETHIICCRRT